MKKLWFLTFFFFLATGICGQPGWTWQNPKPQGNPLNSISFLRHYGMAVGEGGTVLHTTDGGQTWRNIDLGIKENLNDVIMHDDLMAFVAGDNGFLAWVMYHDSRDSFEVKRFATNTDGDLHSVTSDINNCPWVSGDDGFIYRSSDFGATWTRQNAFYNFNFSDLDNIECTEAWAVGPDGAVIYSYDLGNTWELRFVPTSWDLYSIDVLTFENIRTCGQQGNIWFTADKGLTWEKEYEELGFNLYGIENVGLNTAYAVGSDGKILETTDYGVSWEHRNSGTTYPLYDVTTHGYGYDEEWAVGYHGIMVKNSGLGTDFDMQTTGNLLWLFSLDIYGENAAWAVGGDPGYGGTTDGIILFSSDKGRTWEQQKKLDVQLSAVDFISETEGWAVGDDGTILHTVNGGDYWSVQDCPLRSDLMSVSFTDSENGWVVSRWAEIIHTSNGGKDWVRQTNPSPNPLHDVFFVNENLGFAAGLDSTILRTRDGGESWEQMILRCSNNFRFSSLFFMDENYGWATGVTGAILLTEDGGDTWMEVESGVPTTIILEDVYFIDHDNGWIAGDRGTVLRTMNGGHTWFQMETGVTDNYLAGIRFMNHQDGLVVGEAGTVISTESGGFGSGYGTMKHHGLNLPILDNETVVDIIEFNIGEGYQLVDLEVYIDSILHPSVSDLEIVLVHDGIIDTLAYHLNEGGEDMIWTVFSGNAGKSINEAFAPYSGTYLPYQDFYRFLGMDPSGEWRLEIFDSVEGNTGILEAWGIKPVYEVITSEPESTDPDMAGPELTPAYPNPVSDVFEIGWKSMVNDHVNLSVYDLMGKRHKVLVDKFMPAGEYTVGVNCKDLAPGMYLYRLYTGGISRIGKILVIR